MTAAGTRAGRLSRRQHMALILTLLLAVCLAWPPPALSLGLPGRRQPPREQTIAGPPPGRLQDVAPPPVVQELRQALAEHEPQITILTPADGSLIAAGPWMLRLRVEDWPLLDAGPLGLGPHLVAQLDDQPAIRLTSTEAEMPPLSPGSHRLTVYAARPWGEALKNPGAYRQIRLHRVAANPLAVPAPGSPQLIPVQPTATPQAEPVLLDWLLLDAPLQNLRGIGSEGWRLRVTINGDSFLVDQQTPLWLKGWRDGANSLQLELVDGRGEPLNPPFNTLVQEVTIARDAQRPRWQGGPLQPLERLRLLGEAPPEAEPETEPETEPEPEPEPSDRDVLPEPMQEPMPEAAIDTKVESTSLETETSLPLQPEPDAAAPIPAPHPEPVPADAQPEQTAEPAAPITATQPATEATTQAERQEEALPAEAVAAEASSAPGTADEASSPPTAQADPPAAAAAAPTSPAEPPAETNTPPSPPPPPPGSPSAPRVAAGGLPPARQEVNPDGTLIRPDPQGPLARLRQRLGR